MWASVVMDVAALACLAALCPAESMLRWTVLNESLLIGNLVIGELALLLSEALGLTDSDRDLFSTAQAAVAEVANSSSRY